MSAMQATAANTGPSVVAPPGSADGAAVANAGFADGAVDPATNITIQRPFLRRSMASMLWTASSDDEEHDEMQKRRD